MHGVVYYIRVSFSVDIEPTVIIIRFIINRKRTVQSVIKVSCVGHSKPPPPPFLDDDVSWLLQTRRLEMGGILEFPTHTEADLH